MGQKVIFSADQVQPVAPSAPQTVVFGADEVQAPSPGPTQPAPPTALARRYPTATNFAAMDQAERERTAAGASLMPSIGGAIGGFAGGVPGAVAGGMAGEAVRQSVLRGQGSPEAPSTKTAQAKAMAISGALQGLFQGTGQIVGAAAPRGSRWLMNRALNPTERLSREFPELSQTMIDNAFSVSKGGYGKARDMLLAAKVVANGAVRQADKAGIFIPRSAVSEGLDRTLQDVMKASANKIGDLNKLARLEREITQGYGERLSVAEADALKTELQRKARQFYAAARGPNGQPALEVVGKGYADVATQLNMLIDDATTQAGASGYRAANATAQELIGTVRALRQAIRPSKNLYQAMVRPGVGMMLGGAAGSREGHPVAGAIAGAIATSPGMLSRQAIVLGNPYVQRLLQQAPRAFAPMAPVPPLPSHARAKETQGQGR